MKWKNLGGLVAVAAISALSTHAYGQGYVDDALRISRPQVGGTTRTLSLGGAFSSLGGDIGTLNSNPAGLGFFRKSDVSISPQYNSSALTSTYFYNKENTNKTSWNLANIGIVFAHSSPEADRGLATDNRLVSFAFGAGYSRTNNINTNISFSGHNPGQSFNSLLSQQANTSGINSQDYGSTLGGIAFDEYLINPTNKAQTTFAPIQGSNLDQSGNIQENGYTDETNFSFGANFGNTVYVGAGLNFENLNYERQTNFYETGIQDPSQKIDGITYSKYTTQNGSGINGKAGIIFNLNNALHIGGYVQSPTDYTIYETADMGLWGLKNNQQVSPSVNYTDSQGNVSAGSYDPTISSEYSYHVHTPWKYTGGASLILGRFALFTGEAEYIDYRQTKYESDNSTSDMLVNSGINGKYKAVINYRAGAELKFGSLVIRGGYAFYPSPIVNTLTDADQRVLSAGFGFRSGNFYIDFGGYRDFSRSYRTLYTMNDGSGPSLKQYNIISSGTITIGTKF